MKSFFIVILITVAGFGIWYALQSSQSVEEKPSENEITYAENPENTTYYIEGDTYALVNGKLEQEVTPGSATKVITSLFGEPIYGDLDYDGDDDALVRITHDPGGSGTFYYFAVAENIDGTYKGTNAILLGDRIAPQTAEIRNALIIVNYADRTPEEPMTARPSIGKTAYAVLKDDNLAGIDNLGISGEEVVQGYLVIGNEVQTFRACGEGEPEHWILGDSLAFQNIKDVYNRAYSSPKPYTPLFVTIAGIFEDAPTDGFGTDYESAIMISQFISASPVGNCKSDKIFVTSPLPGTVVTSPITIKGFARGPWYFEASFPLVLTNWDGLIIVEHFATAKDEWMTTNFVPFEAKLQFEKPASGEGIPDTGTLIFKKDNPSDLPEHDDAYEMTIYFE